MKISTLLIFFAFIAPNYLQAAVPINSNLHSGKEQNYCSQKLEIQRDTTKLNLSKEEEENTKRLNKLGLASVITGTIAIVLTILFWALIYSTEFILLMFISFVFSLILTLIALILTAIVLSGYLKYPKLKLKRDWSSIGIVLVLLALLGYIIPFAIFLL